MEDAGHPRLVPWRNHEEWEGVRDCFYPKNEGQSAEGIRRQACATTRMWASRCPLPHSVEATSFLTEGILMNDSYASTQAKRLAMSMAIVRFVNGLLDPAQQAQYAISLHTLAKTLRLPASFVEMRHAATHETLPSIEVLSESIRRALHWLYLNYWISEQTHEKQSSPTMHEQAAIFLHTLQKWQDQKSGEGRRGIQTYTDVVQRLIRITGPHLLGEVLVKNAIAENDILSGSQGSKPTNSDFAKWMPLLDALVTCAAHIPQDFLMACVRSVTSLSTTAGSKEVLVPWILRLCQPVGDSKKQIHKWTADVQQVLSACSSAPNKWSKRLVEQLVSQDPFLTFAHGPIFSKLDSIAPAKVDRKRTSLEDLEAEVTERRKRLLELQQEEAVPARLPARLRGWQQCDNWVSKPIGFWTS